jgi:hypothetical protein
MAALTTAEKKRLRNALIDEQWAGVAGGVGVTKADLDAAAAAVNDWIETAAVQNSFNSALTTNAPAFAAWANAAQKQLLFAYVLLVRVGLR